MCWTPRSTVNPSNDTEYSNKELRQREMKLKKKEDEIKKSKAEIEDCSKDNHHCPICCGGQWLLIYGYNLS
jgi:hypothetical protein